MTTINLRPYGLDTTDPAWEGLKGQPEVEIPGVYGPGGFVNNSTLTGPATGPPPGTSLTTTPTNAVGSGNWDPRNWFKADPTATFEAGKPMEQIAAGGAVPSLLTGAGSPYWRALIAGAGATAPTPAETGEFNPAMVRGRPEAPMSSVHGNPTAAPATYPHMPWPDTGVAPAASPRASAASPAAARQRPNLGTYNTPPAAVANSPFILADRPNMSPQNSARGRQGAEQMGMLDLSRLFGGGQPAPTAAAPVAATPAYKIPATRGVASTSAAPSDYGPLQRNRIWGFKGDPSLRS